MADEQTERKKATTEREQVQSRSRGQQASEQGQSSALSHRQEFMASFPSWSESPFALMRRFSEDMDRIFGELFSHFGIPRARSHPVPAAARACNRVSRQHPSRCFSKVISSLCARSCPA